MQRELIAIKFRGELDACFNAITDAYATNRKQWVHHTSNKKRNGWSDKFDCIIWQARNLHSLAKKARRGHHEDSLWQVLDKMAEKFRTISSKTKKDMPDAFAEAWKIPAIPKSASLRTLQEVSYGQTISAAEQKPC